MAEKREGYAPFSIEREAGVQSATVNGTIDVVQEIRPTLTTGFIDERGDWKGLKSSDEQFIAFGVDEAIPNTGTITQPQRVGDADERWPIDMTGFDSIFFAINPTNGGNYAIEAIQGPENFANLGTVNAGSIITIKDRRGAAASLQSAFVDSAQSLTADVWNIFQVQGVLANQKLLQFKITNNSGGESTIQTAFMRLVL
jgi:hypothetical protein